MLESMKQFEIKKESLITVFGGTLIVNSEEDKKGKKGKKNTGGTGGGTSGGGD